MIRAMVIMILAGLTFLQGCLPSPAGSAKRSATPTSTPSPSAEIFVEATEGDIVMPDNWEPFISNLSDYIRKILSDWASKAVSGAFLMEPNPSILPTSTRQHRKVTPEPTVEATPNPTPTEIPPTIEPTPTEIPPTVEPAPTEIPRSVCVQECKAACDEAGLKWKDCKDDCDCWKESE